MTTSPKALRAVAAGALAAAALAGCKDFLTANTALNNPNYPTASTAGQALTAVETNQTELQTGDPARNITMWMQQFSGTQGQYTANAQYNLTADFSDGYWSTVYQGGGLIDIRSAESQAEAAGDSVTAGIARVLEAYTIGTAADWWGDVPYSKALTVGAPAPFDGQLSVYAGVQTVLDRAIAQLSSGKGNGPGAGDLFYGGSASKWIAAANTLKARFYLHTAEAKGTAADGTPAFTAAAYQSALTYAAKGISSAANDMRSYQSSATTSQNLWYQFTVVQRAGYIAPSDFFVNLVAARKDTRLTTYLAPGPTAASGEIIGSGVTSALSGNVAVLNPATTGAPDYRQPLLTYAENQMILAEANYRLGNTAAALAAYNAERTSAGQSTLSTLPTGAAGLTEIMTEKYVALFENQEVWSDYRRTCVPALQPISGAGGFIPARFPYPLNETNTNPNTPPNPQRNANDPNPCSVNGTQTSN